MSKPTLQIYVVKDGFSTSHKTKKYIKSEYHIALEETITLSLPEREITLYADDKFHINDLEIVLEREKGFYLIMFISDDDKAKEASDALSDFILNELKVFYEEKSKEEQLIIKNMSAASELLFDGQAKKAAISTTTPAKIVLTDELRNRFIVELEKLLNKAVLTDGGFNLICSQHHPEDYFNIEVYEIQKHDEQLLFSGRASERGVFFYRWRAERSLWEQTTLSQSQVTKLKKTTQAYFEEYLKGLEDENN